jgi:hypothetical protein
VKPLIQPALVVVTILVGLVVDRHGGAWGQPLVSLWVWLLFGVLMFQAADLRLRLLACLLIATAGEVVLSLVWGLYDYRLGNLPLFVPPGHVLLYWLGLQWAGRLPGRVIALTPWLALAGVSALAVAGIDWMGPALLAHVPGLRVAGAGSASLHHDVPAVPGHGAVGHLAGPGATGPGGAIRPAGAGLAGG